MVLLQPCKYGLRCVLLMFPLLTIKGFILKRISVSYIKINRIEIDFATFKHLPIMVQPPTWNVFWKT